MAIHEGDAGARRLRRTSHRGQYQAATWPLIIESVTDSAMQLGCFASEYTNAGRGRVPHLAKLDDETASSCARGRGFRHRIANVLLAAPPGASGRFTSLAGYGEIEIPQGCTASSWPQLTRDTKNFQRKGMILYRPAHKIRRASSGLMGN